MLHRSGAAFCTKKPIVCSQVLREHMQNPPSNSGALRASLQRVDRSLPQTRPLVMPRLRESKLMSASLAENSVEVERIIVAAATQSNKATNNLLLWNVEDMESHEHRKTLSIYFTRKQILSATLRTGGSLLIDPERPYACCKALGERFREISLDETPHTALEEWYKRLSMGRPSHIDLTAHPTSIQPLTKEEQREQSTLHRRLALGPLEDRYPVLGSITYGAPTGLPVDAGSAIDNC